MNPFETACQNRHYPGTLYPMDTAPKDSTVVLLLSEEDEVPDGEGGMIKREPQFCLGKWDQETEVWICGDGWLQPDEVTHWSPLPGIPFYHPTYSPLPAFHLV